MKKSFLFTLGIICMIFLFGCENDKYFTKFSNSAELNGIWIRVDSELYSAYSYDLYDDTLDYHQHHGYIDKENYFICNKDSNWQQSKKFSFIYEFNPEDQSLYISGNKIGTITRLGKNKAYYKDFSGFLRDCTLQRVKGVKFHADEIVPTDTIPTDTIPSDPADTVTPSQNGILSGEFSISATKKVHFSQGNLQYQASNNVWRFAENQYDCVGDDNANISEYNDGWIDLYNWGTGNNPTSISYESRDYSTFIDWGTNCIVNGGNTPNIWFTLSQEEWQYLLETRSNAGELCAQVTITGIHGLIILPDNWQKPAEISWNSSPQNWSTNNYSIDSWQKLEKSGAVFLPASGLRKDGTEIASVGALGNYWSSTPIGELDAYSLHFSWNHINTLYYKGRRHGRAVRLVQIVK